MLFEKFMEIGDRYINPFMTEHYVASAVIWGILALACVIYWARRCAYEE